jgi:hypothetical protein
MSRGHKTFSSPQLLSEKAFRRNWSLARKRPKETEEERFARVLPLLEKDLANPQRKLVNLMHKPGIKKAVVEIITDGKRRTVSEIADLLPEGWAIIH